MKKRIILSAVLSLAALANSFACTNLIVGKNASTDGSTIVSYSADSYGLFGELYHYPAATYPKGTMLKVYEWDTGKYLGEIEQARQTYNVTGNMNEFQVTIGETTFGGRPELADSTEIKWRISLSKAEILVHTIEVTFLASEGNHIRRSDTVFFVVHVKLMDTGLIGMSRDTIIRYTYSRPDSTTYPRSLTDHFHNPDFIRIGNRKRFTSTIIAILLYQVSHDTDRFAGRT